jgi:hypothetical protein
METEFINEYINKLIANLHDLTSKNVMLETRLAIAEKVVASLQNEIHDIKSKQSKPKTSE